VSNFDVTPVGRAPGEGAAGGSGARGDGSDPFGSLPSVRRPGWVRIVLGALALVGGIVAAVVGILDAVETGGKIEKDAVARGVMMVSDGEFGAPVTFAVPAGESRGYTVYLIFDDNIDSDGEESAAVRDSRCQVKLPNERLVTFGGNRQGVSNTFDRASSIGTFSSPPGAVEVRCAYAPGARRSRRVRPERVDYVVTPGVIDGLGGGTGLIVAGVFVAIGGGFLLRWGLRGRRRVIAPSA
jgi:hypothetical protein